MSGSDDSPTTRQEGSTPDRRDFLSKTSSLAMAGGLAASYGTLGVMAAGFIYPHKGEPVAWRFVATLDRLAVGDSMTFIAPSGAKIVVARQGPGETAEDFIALSSVCPHLGCQVHWEPHNNRFFCPCHNGAFDPEGNATEGPPAAAKQQLTRFPLRVENGLLFMEVPLKVVGQAVAAARSTVGTRNPSRQEA